MTSFPDNPKLEAIQIESFWPKYSQNGSEIFRAARSRYLESAKLMQINNELVGFLAKNDTLFTDIFYDSYCEIAEEYRFQLGADGDQTLFESELEWEVRLTKGWVVFYSDECRRIAFDDQACINIVKAICYQGTKKGNTALAGISSFMANNYEHSMLSWKHLHWKDTITTRRELIEG